VDKLIDHPPYRPTQHLKLKIGWFAATSYGLIIQKSAHHDKLPARTPL
jgi:hypothetical protein